MRFFFISVLILSIFFRFAHLDNQVYWLDEAITSLRASGYTEQEFVERFSQNSVATVIDIQQYQHPNGTRSVLSTVQSLVKEDPQLSPLYYILANFWFSSIGSSPAAARLLPALLSLLIFPSVYWLCQELFVKTDILASRLPMGIAVSLIAVSPFQVLYARESRHYSLWTVTTLLSTAALLRATRVNTKASWGIYTLTITIDLYTSVLAALVMLAHGIYIIIITKFCNLKIFKAYLRASLAGIIGFLPWVLVVISNLSQIKKVTDWTNATLQISLLINSWVKIFGRIFFDVNNEYWNFYVHRIMLVLIIYAFYCLCRYTPMSVWLLIILLTAIPALSLMIPDIILGGMRSATARYLIPSLLGVQLAVAYMLSKNLTSISLKSWQKTLYGLLLIFLILADIMSCAVNIQSPVPWNKSHNGENITIAKVINQTNQSLLLSDAFAGYILSLSHLLKPTTQLFIQPSCQTCQIPTLNEFGVKLSALEKLEKLNRFSDIFLYHTLPSENWLQQLTKQPKYKFEPSVFSFPEWAENKPALWKVLPK